MPLIRIILRAGPAHPRAAVAAIGAALAVTAAAACGGRDPFAPDPRNNVDTQQSDVVLYPLSTATGPYVSAIELLSLSGVRPGLAFLGAGIAAPNFDFAVDRTSDGRVRLLPSRLVVDLTGVGQVYRTGFQLATVPFDSIAEAPPAGYRADSAFTVNVGQPVIVQSQSALCTSYYAKAVVVSVDAVTGAFTLRTRVNPNCGFRSLRPGRG
jgi:hypothetical protein